MFANERFSIVYAGTRAIFPNNVIPTAMISPVASALFGSSLYPGVVNGNLQNNALNLFAVTQSVKRTSPNSHI